MGKAVLVQKKYPGPEWERKISEEFSKSSLALLVPFSDEIHQSLQYPILICAIRTKMVMYVISPLNFGLYLFILLFSLMWISLLKLLQQAILS